MNIDLAYISLNESKGNMWIGTITIIKEDNLGHSNKLYLIPYKGGQFPFSKVRKTVRQERKQQHLQRKQ